MANLLHLGGAPVPGKHRRWAFTLHHMITSNDAWRAQFANICESSDQCRYMICQVEEGHDATVVDGAKRRHTQGYFETKDAVPYTTAKKVIGYDHVHVEAARKTAAVNKKYCTKDDTGVDGFPYFEYGQVVKQGERTDITTFTDALARGDPLADTALANPGTYVKFHSGLAKFAALARGKRKREARNVIVLFGPTGTGKTESAMNADEGLYRWTPCMMQASGTPWFDGYDGETTMLLDEFRGQFTFAYLLIFLDKYHVQVQVKAASTPHTADTIYITSPIHPVNWYPNKFRAGGDSMAQLRRRISKIIFTGAPAPADGPSDGHATAHEDVTEKDWEDFRAAYDFTDTTMT